MSEPYDFFTPTTQAETQSAAGQADARRERVARAICTACEEHPDHAGGANGNAFRWQDYLFAADAAIAAY